MTEKEILKEIENIINSRMIKIEGLNYELSAVKKVLFIAEILKKFKENSTELKKFGDIFYE